MTIQVLADDVISKIAAGEVIERPASVVKELIENAIDAGANEIRIRIEAAGKQLIEVSDNGCGIAGSELRTAVTRHATSKLRTEDDLFRLITLGFRGEALASAGSVSKMSILSRSADEPIGNRIQVAGAQVVNEEPVATTPGTIVRIEDLFYNVPARLKFLKSDTTEKNQISTLITRYALAYAGIRWELILEGKTVLQTAGNGDFREILSSIYGLEIAKQLLEIDEERDGIRVFGYISPIALTRSNRREINFFVNGRWIQDQQLVAAVNRAYQSLIMVGRYPISALFIHVEPEDVDVNVHPSKSEVRFRSADAVFSAVHHSVRRGLQLQAPIPQLRSLYPWQSSGTDGNRPEPFNPETVTPGERPAWQSEPFYTERAGNEQTGDSQGQDFYFDTAQAGATGSAVTGNVTDGRPDIPQGAHPLPTALPPNYEHPTFLRPHTDGAGNVFPLLRWIGQIGNTYVLAEGPDGLYLIDQHAAHERILFEKLMRRSDDEYLSVPLLDPAIVRLQPAEAALIEENRDLLSALGFELEPFGPNDYRIYAIPEIFTRGNPALAIRSLVEDFEEDETPLQNAVSERIAARVCKTMAVKAGQSLSEEEQKLLIRELEACESPRTCPHGRPTMIHLSIRTLEQQFGRKGKL